MKFAKTLRLAALAVVVATTTAAARNHPDSAPALNDKGALLRGFSQVAKKQWGDYCYDEDTQERCFDEDCEMCFDEDYNQVSCGVRAEGGCTCPEGLTKCDGYSITFCRAVCCDSDTQETCYDEDYNPVSCGDFAEGGCTCPEDLTKCNGPFCTAVGSEQSICCDSDTQETCYDENLEPESCALIEKGGCPCPEGEVKCVAGLCMDVCCDSDKGELYCYDDDFNFFCATNECPSNARSYDMQKNQMAMLIQTKGTQKETSYFHNLNMQQKKLLADVKSNVNSDELALKQKEVELVRTIKLREGNTFAKNEISL